MPLWITYSPRLPEEGVMEAVQTKTEDRASFLKEMLSLLFPRTLKSKNHLRGTAPHLCGAPAHPWGSFGDNVFLVGLFSLSNEDRAL